ncbi:MAG: NAD(+) diphosphatase [Lachnospiraceae bacterium]|nr:NAD(+) diphosphatase [Lachnospiraceae bacterium]
MIQDIAPHQYQVSYQPKPPRDTDVVLIYRENVILAEYREGEIRYPTIAEIRTVFPQAAEKARFLFRMDTQDYYELQEPVLEEFQSWKYENIAVLREAKPMWKAFAGVTGYQIHTWYRNTRFCGRCGTEMRLHGQERAMYCPACGKITYPTIAPSVIVGVTDADRLLLTRYAANHSDYRKYALVAGYVEVGETLEDTVRREVMEEVGLKVKNIRYYKSQPWAFTGTLLTGFFCEVDGDSSIRLEEEELCEATWFRRDEIPVHPSTISLTNEMIEYFRTASPNDSMDTRRKE